MPEPRRVLILGGTAEAVALAGWAATQPGLAVTSSLAGRTQAPNKPAGAVRVGGFGGPEGLAAYVCQHRIEAVVDATHPYAARMSANAAEACGAAAIPHLVLDRPPWTRVSGDRWIEVGDREAAARAVAEVAKRAFLTLGSSELAPFAAVRGVWFLVRLIEPSRAALPLGPHAVIYGRGPFTLAREAAVMAAYQTEALVSKNSGGPATYAKIAAARATKLPVVMLRRPRRPSGERVATVEDAARWLAERFV